MERAENKFLCLPCAVRLQGENSTEVRIGSSQRQKSTCEECRRRRYGYNCVVRHRKETADIKGKELYVCIRCRGQLEGRLEFKELPGTFATQRKCAFCGKASRTSLYKVTDRLDRK